jgi:hypothetical protein
MKNFLKRGLPARQPGASGARGGGVAGNPAIRSKPAALLLFLKMSKQNAHICQLMRTQNISF